MALVYECNVLYIAAMYIETVPNRTSPPAILLRESHRDGTTTRKRTLEIGRAHV